jgi:tripartite-type tricarboxylate transporter receptor subunit TctC
MASPTHFRVLLGTILVTVAWIASGSLSRADGVADFYHGKSFTIAVGSAPGGGYDAYARLIARHFGRHVPGDPAVTVQNMPGAGSLNMVNHVANIAPRDGTIMGAPQTGVAFEPVFKLLSPDGSTARFDATQFGWIGNASKDIIVPFVWYESPVKSFDDLLTTPVRMGANETNTDNSIMAVLLIRMFKAKITLYNGYPGSSSNLMLAIESGELDGLAGMPYTSLTSRSADMVRDGKLRFLAQMGLTKLPELGDVPLLLDKTKTPEERETLSLILIKNEMARPYFAGPQIPKDRLEALRKAFADNIKDPETISDAKKSGLDLDYVSGPDVQALVAKVYATPPAMAERVRDVLRSDRPDH